MGNSTRSIDGRVRRRRMVEIRRGVVGYARSWRTVYVDGKSWAMEIVPLLGRVRWGGWRGPMELSLSTMGRREWCE